MLKDAAVRERFVKGGADPTPSPSPEAFARQSRAEAAKWTKVAKDAGICPEQ